MLFCLLYYIYTHIEYIYLHVYKTSIFIRSCDLRIRFFSSIKNRKLGFRSEGSSQLLINVLSELTLHRSSYTHYSFALTVWMLIYRC
ncbi:hypothetical protein L1987_65451 [Smallanthus sonchifolius]|uniref:Uncharacterized protein n=1 Tax=Smallanthus sonchifolius TaxID=185202 RepID=A0ACB9BUH6_9ASTR|nr:hypothetical protein L1987_65451 [Smallanthus sonchifolius]